MTRRRMLHEEVYILCIQTIGVNDVVIQCLVVNWTLIFWINRGHYMSYKYSWIQLYFICMFRCKSDIAFLNTRRALNIIQIFLILVRFCIGDWNKYSQELVKYIYMFMVTHYSERNSLWRNEIHLLESEKCFMKKVRNKSSVSSSERK